MMHTSLKLESPAKINLFLRVLNRRSDGYHNLASLFQTLDLHDTLTFSLSQHDLLTCTNPLIPTDPSNLILKAVSLFRKKTGLNFGLKVHLEKKIPHQAGLGGGSSNAATTLWALNKLCQTSYSDEELAKWSSEIGSDIPFFFSRGTAYCTGRGEIIQKLPPLKKRALQIVKPFEGLATATIFQKLNLLETERQDPQTLLKSFFTDSPQYYNDLEQPAFEVLPSLCGLKQQLKECGFETVLMTGSGSAFFCIGEGKLPLIPNLYVASTQFINRSCDDWYKLTNRCGEKTFR